MRGRKSWKIKYTQTILAERCPLSIHRAIAKVGNDKENSNLFIYMALSVVFAITYNHND